GETVKGAIEMKRIVFLYSLLLICSLGAGNVEQAEVSLKYGVAFGQAVAGKTCPFSITGTWKIEGSTRIAKTQIYEFVPNGMVIFTEHTDDVIPREFEVIGGGKYALDRREAPKRLEFIGIAIDKRTAIRRGKTSLQVVEYGDDSFVTLNPKTQAETRWFRAQTQRYFLTFAARGGPSPSAFAMWATLDGRQAKIEALGLQMENRGGASPVFGLIPDRLYREFEIESLKNSDAMFRLELTEAEFGRSHKVFEAWADLARIGKLPSTDPYINGMEFLKSAAGNLNQCDEKLKLPATGGASAQNPHQEAFEYIKEMRKKNKGLHVTDGMFPTDWRPTLLPDG
ncbi:MAG: hypothetical protein L0220_10000, partial [Acidobacteria bacterium]|nr:hypothetical protein [Acidobacteriota bacterium]